MPTGVDTEANTSEAALDGPLESFFLAPGRAGYLPETYRRLIVYRADRMHVLLRRVVTG